MIRRARKIAETAPFKDMVVKELNPGLEVQTDEQLGGMIPSDDSALFSHQRAHTDWLKATFSTTWHTAGSCSMLPKEKHGVVDPDLKVYGTNNLHVVDLSIVPLHFAAHPQGNFGKPITLVGTDDKSP